MKMQSTHAISRKVFSLILAAVISGLMPQTVSAHPGKTLGKGVEITYAGTRDKGVIFNVNYKNELSQPFQLTVRNEQNDVLYIEQYGATVLHKSILFSEVPENCKLTFSIVVGRKEFSSQTFEIKSHVKTVEELKAVIDKRAASCFSGLCQSACC